MKKPLSNKFNLENILDGMLQKISREMKDYIDKQLEINLKEIDNEIVKENMTIEIAQERLELLKLQKNIIIENNKNFLKGYTVVNNG